MRQTTHTFAATLAKRVRLPYWLALPDAAAPPPWPLLLFLHGSGERGADLARVTALGVPAEVAAGRRLPFVVVAPQCPADTVWSVHLDALAALLDYVAAEYPIDPARVSVTGLSMGGTGAWHLAVTYPERFAALAPVCGDRVWYVGDPAQVRAIRHVPVWAFHGARDPVVPVSASEELVAALRGCGGDARLTVYPDVGHSAWRAAYATDALYEWLAAPQRGCP